MREFALLIMFAAALTGFAQDEQPMEADSTLSDTVMVEEPAAPATFTMIKRSDFASSKNKVEVNGDFDSPFCHPTCAAVSVEEKEGCTTQALIDDIKKNLTYDPAESGKPVEADEAVDINFSINQFGNIKSIKVIYTGDSRITQSIIQALYSVPRMVPALKEGINVPCTVKMSIPYQSIFGEE